MRALVIVCGFALASCAAPPVSREGEGEGEGSVGEGEGTVGEGEGEGEGAVPTFLPSTGTTWQWQLSGLPVDTSFNVSMYDIDLFDNDATVIEGLHADGRAVVCYVSVGTWEPFRDDADQFPPEVKGHPYDPPFQDEVWLDVRDERVRTLMKARFDVAVTKHCDAIEPDNIGFFDQDTGFPLTAADNIEYAHFISDQVHTRGMSVGLKNDIDQAGDLVDAFDWALNEQCNEFSECDAYSSNFVAAGKAVFNAEYQDASQAPAICAATTPLGLSTIIKDIELDASVTFCP